MSFTLRWRLNDVFGSRFCFRTINFQHRWTKRCKNKSDDTGKIDRRFHCRILEAIYQDVDYGPFSPRIRRPVGIHSHKKTLTHTCRFLHPFAQKGRHGARPPCHGNKRVSRLYFAVGCNSFYWFPTRRHKCRVLPPNPVSSSQNGQHNTRKLLRATSNTYIHYHLPLTSIYCTLFHSTHTGTCFIHCVLCTPVLWSSPEFSPSCYFPSLLRCTYSLLTKTVFHGVIFFHLLRTSI